VEASSLIIDDRERGLFRVHRSTMTSPEILALEQQRIFERCWLYVGHESEIPKPGDFRRRVVGGKPLIFIHGSDGEIRALFNACTHRGATICRQDEGNARIFQCFYHAWTFDTKGDLVQVPDEEAYACLDKSERGLKAPAQFDDYRGLYFVNYDPDAEDLEPFLAGAKEYLDLVVDQSGDGLQVLSGSNIYGTSANWKLLVENSADGYHAIPTHSTYFDFLASYGEGMGDLVAGAGRGLDLGNGHAVLEGPTPQGRPVASWHPMFGDEAKEGIAAKRKEVVNRVGDERGSRICDYARNLLIFPNFAIVDTCSLTFRTWQPVAADAMNINAWCVGPIGETPDQIKSRVDGYITFLGPAGFATPDDVEALESCQQGFSTWQLGEEWSDISRGMNRLPQAVDEIQMRTFWRAWQAHLEERPVERITGVETPEPAAVSG
jgi:phenylpropionate dioxygenase-like ring-hydroxylating dioxygenase large terminal subunit